MKTEVLEMLIIAGSLYIDTDLWNKDSEQYESALLTFDTGATVTTISVDVLSRLGYDCSAGRVVAITTASGVENVRKIVIDKIKLGEHELEDVEVYAHNFPVESFSTGVVGLNVLAKFDINLLFSSRLIKLTGTC